MNKACRVDTPIHLPSVDHVAALANIMQENGVPDIEFWKADHESAFKQLPLRGSHYNMVLVAVGEPLTGILWFSKARNLPFGAVSSVAHYTAASRAVASLFARIFRIPVVGYFDDFCGVTPEGLAQQALELF